MHGPQITERLGCSPKEVHQALVADESRIIDILADVLFSNLSEVLALRDSAAIGLLRLIASVRPKSHHMQLCDF